MAAPARDFLLTPTLPAVAESTRGFDGFVNNVEILRSRTADPRELATGVARELGLLLRCPGWLKRQDRLPGAETYRQHLLHVAPDGGFSVVSLVWKPGQRTPIHDHVAWCVVGVYEGVETETRYRLFEQGRQRFLVQQGTRVAHAGDTTALVPPSENIHEVRNDGSSLAISIHVYGANIRERGTSIYECFDHVEQRAGPGSARPILWRAAA